jgi:hypothetical protein
MIAVQATEIVNGGVERWNKIKKRVDRLACRADIDEVRQDLRVRTNNDDGVSNS